jgi:hypothetical protein
MSTVNAGWRGPNIVKEGLVLYLDAASGASYSPYTSGVTWRDISGNGNNGTLTNGPTYSSANGGSFTFDGVNDYVIGTSNLPIFGDSSFTIAYFAIWDGINFLNEYPSGVGNNSTGTISQGLSTTWRSGRIALDFWNDRFRDNTALNVQTWYYVSFTKTPGLIGSTIKLYVNAQERTGAVEGSNVAPNITISPFVVGRLDASRYFNGRISSIQIYNRALSAQEVLQNYNSAKSRFNL